MQPLRLSKEPLWTSSSSVDYVEALDDVVLMDIALDLAVADAETGQSRWSLQYRQDLAGQFPIGSDYEQGTSATVAIDVRTGQKLWERSNGMWPDEIVDDAVLGQVSKVLPVTGCSHAWVTTW